MLAAHSAQECIACRSSAVELISRIQDERNAPYTDIPANLLFFERGGPSDTIWYYELPLPEGRKKYSKTALLQFEEFAQASAWWNNREEGPQAWNIDFAAKREAAVAATTPHWQRAEGHLNAAIALGKPIRELEQSIQVSANSQKAELQNRLKMLKSEQSTRENFRITDSEIAHGHADCEIRAQQDHGRGIPDGTAGCETA
ncbi:MAG: hypothetical protein RIQ52_953 [Pseudomonadota bacterium]|jgi:type I restriction-modification system DNA methylase subunit